MGKKTFTKQDIENAVFEDLPEDPPLEVEHRGEWISSGKYQDQEVILRDTTTQKFYVFHHSRSGSPFSDYYYTLEDKPDEVELTEVVKTTKVIEVWVGAQ